MATFRQIDGKWVAEVCVGGRRKSKRWPSKAQAKSWAAATEVALAAAQSGDLLEVKNTLAMALVRYAGEVSEHKKGARWEIIRLKLFARYAIAGVRLADMRREDVEAFIAARKGDGLAGSSINRELNLLSHVLTECRRWRWMSHKPMEDLKRPKGSAARDRRIYPFELKPILRALDYSEESPPRMKKQRVALAFLLAIETAMRCGELCGVTADHLDLVKRTAYLPDTKNGTARWVPLSSEAVRLFQRIEDWPESGPVLGVSAGVVSTLFRRAVKETDIKNLTFHDSRHEAITRLAGKLDVLDLARMVGHKNIKQLMTYYNKTAEELARQLD